MIRGHHAPVPLRLAARPPPSPTASARPASALSPLSRPRALPRPTRLVVVALSLLVAAGGAVVACRALEPLPRQLDLWFRRPDEVNHRRLHDDERRTFYRGFGNRAVRAVLQRPDERLHWDLQLGSERRFSFRPLAIAGECTFVVAAGPGRGKALEQWRTTRRAGGGLLPPQVTVPLPDAEPLHFALAVSGEGCQAAWGSPVIQHRRGHRPKPAAERPNLILIGLDTLRADAVGTYLAGREGGASLTPALDAFAARSDVFLDAHTNANNTNPSFISLLTGLYNKNHGIYDLLTPLPASYTTLPEILAAAGYDTVAVPAVHHLAVRSGLDQGFERFLRPRGQFYAETVVDYTIDRIERAEPPFFLFTHFFDPHVPHTPPPPYAEGLRPATEPGWEEIEEWVPFRKPGLRLFASLRPRHLAGHVELYPSEVAYLDRELGRLFAYLEAHGLLDSSLVVIVGDHGETLGERGAYFDHEGLHANTTHVPLLVHWPGQSRGRRISGLVQHLDVFPTFLAAAGVAAPRHDGRDLRLLAEGEAEPRPAVFSEAANGRGEAVRTRRWLYYMDRKLDRERTTTPHLYDLQQDPGETTNLAGSGHPEERRLRELLGRWLLDRDGGERGKAQKLTAEEEQELRSLGYL